MLDTSAVSEFFRGNPAVKEHVKYADELCLNPVVLGELLYGFIAGDKEPENRELLRRLMASPLVTIADIDAETSERYAMILGSLKKAGTPVPTNDVWIAACAMQHGLSVLTTDQDYLLIPQVLTEYCEPG